MRIKNISERFSHPVYKHIYFFFIFFFSIFYAIIVVKIIIIIMRNGHVTMKRSVGGDGRFVGARTKVHKKKNGRESFEALTSRNRLAFYGQLAFIFQVVQQRIYILLYSCTVMCS